MAHKNAVLFLGFPNVGKYKISMVSLIKNSFSKSGSPVVSWGSPFSFDGNHFGMLLKKVNCFGL